MLTLDVQGSFLASNGLLSIGMSGSALRDRQNNQASSKYVKAILDPRNRQGLGGPGVFSEMNSLTASPGLTSKWEMKLICAVFSSCFLFYKPRHNTLQM